MEREIRVRFTGDARDMQRATEEARRALNTMGRDTAEFSRTASQNMQRVSESTGQAARNMAAELGKMAAAYVSVGAAAALFWKGLSHNAELESLKLGMATIVSANETIKDSTGKQVEGAQKLAVAQGQVASVFEKLKIDAINTTATLPQLAQAFNAALAPAMAMGISLDDTRKMTVGMVQAMGAMGIPLDQARQEINSILQAQISEDSQLAKNLGLNNEMVKSWKEQGTLVQHLQDKLKDFTVAGAAAGETWNGVTSTLADNMGNLLGILTGDSFNTLKSKLSEVNKSFGTDAQSDAAKWGSIINDSLATAIGLAGGVGSMLLQGAKLFQDALNGIRVGGAKLGGVVLRSDLIHQAVADLPERGNAAQGGSPEGIFRVGKLLPNFLPENMSADSIAGVMEKAGLRGQELEKFKKRLAEIDRMVNEGVSGQTDEILNGWMRTVKQAIAEARQAAGKTITPNKAPAPPPKKGGKADVLTMPAPGKGSWASMFDDDPTATKARDKQDFERWAKENGYNLDPSFIGSDNDPLVKNIKGYKDWKKEEADKWNSTLSAIVSAGGDLADQAINQGGIKASGLLRALGSIGSALGPQGMVLGVGAGIVGNYLDNRDRALGNYDRFSRGEQVSREDYLEASKAKHSDAFVRFMTGSYGENAVNEDMKAFDLLAEAATKAAKAQEELAQKTAAYGATMNVASLREQLGLGKETASDVEKALYSGGIYGGANPQTGQWQGVLGALGNKDVVSQLLDHYQNLQQWSNFDMGDSGKRENQFLSGLGLNSGLANDASTKDVISMYQNVLIPALMSLKDITGGVAAGSISGAGTDNALTFDAPQTRVLNVSQNIVLNTYAVTGDKASFRALVKDIMTEANTVLGQAV